MIKLSIFVNLLPSPDFPYFYYILGGNLGSLLYGDVSVMLSIVSILLSRVVKVLPSPNP